MYWPAPTPNYAAHELREVADIQPHPSRLLQLRQVLNDPEAGFTCYEQAVLLEKMLLRNTNILAIMRCGSGKTFMAMVAAKIDYLEGLTVFILPHSGLHQDFMRRAGNLDLVCSKWEPNGNFNTNAQAIWAAVEHVDFDKFMQCVLAQL